MQDSNDMPAITGTVGPIALDRFDQDQMLADGLAAQDRLSRLRITLVNFEDNPANVATYGVLLNEVWRIIGRS